MRKVMIGTPSHDGRVNVWYMEALLATIRLCPQDMVILPIWWPGEAIVQHARNRLVAIAVEQKVDDLIMIDDDEYWNPEDFYRLLSHDTPIVGGLVPKKKDQLQVTVLRPKNKAESTGLIECDGIGGFVRLRADALTLLWKKSRIYKDGDQELREVYNATIINGELTGEDISMCLKWRALKKKIYADPAVRIAHIGPKHYKLPALEQTEGRKE